jgi:2-dehydropantoate 2-reductase
MTTRYLIFGAGALGALLGARFQEQGLAVEMVGQGASAEGEWIAAQGLSIVNSRTGQRRTVGGLVPLRTLEEVSPLPDDVLILSGKAWETATAVQSLRERYHESTPIVVLPSGVRNEELAARRFRRVYGLLAPLAATWLAPGLLVEDEARPLWLGGYPRGLDEMGEQIASHLRLAGWKVSISESILAVKWNQLVLDLNQATLALLGYPSPRAMTIPAVRELMADVVEEAGRVLAAAGMALEPSGHTLPYHHYLTFLRERDASSDSLGVLAPANLPIGKFPSLWQDLEAKEGQTEAGFLNGEIVRLGEKQGIPTPFNATLLSLIDRVASERLSPGHYPLSELQSRIEQRRRILYHPDPTLLVSSDPDPEQNLPPVASPAPR